MVVLEKSKLFSGLASAELQSLGHSARLQKAPAGSAVFREGDPGNGIYLIKSGTVEISALLGDSGERRALSELAPGDFFGEMAVLDSYPRSATATALEDSELYFISREDVLQMLTSSPAMAVSLMREISQRMREFNRQYVQEMVQAERLSLVGRFARSIVHDFKNPLNVIGIASELVTMDHSTPALRETAKRRIRKQVDRLSNMINELLEFTRGEKSSIVLAESNYTDFVNHVLEDLRPEAADKQVQIEIEDRAGDPRVLIDPKRLTHVFYNLIHNAVDAMIPDGGTIRIRFLPAENGLCTTEIEDTGPGIAEEIAPHLFEAFATHGKENGTGLGLSICRKIVCDHGGEIEAVNAGDGGAMFRFTLKTCA